MSYVMYRIAAENEKAEELWDRQLASAGDGLFFEDLCDAEIEDVLGEYDAVFGCRRYIEDFVEFLRYLTEGTDAVFTLETAGDPHCQESYRIVAGEAELVRQVWEKGDGPTTCAFALAAADGSRKACHIGVAEHAVLDGEKCPRAYFDREIPHSGAIFRSAEELFRHVSGTWDHEVDDIIPLEEETYTDGTGAVYELNFDVSRLVEELSGKLESAVLIEKNGDVETLLNGIFVSGYTKDLERKLCGSFPEFQEQEGK